MDRRKFLTGIAGVTTAGVVLGKEPVTTQLSPPRRSFTNWTMRVKQPADNYYKHGDGLVDIDGRFFLTKARGYLVHPGTSLPRKSTAVVIDADESMCTVASLQHDEIYG